MTVDFHWLKLMSVPCESDLPAVFFKTSFGILAVFSHQESSVT